MNSNPNIDGKQRLAACKKAHNVKDATYHAASPVLQYIGAPPAAMATGSSSLNDRLSRICKIASGGLALDAWYVEMETLEAGSPSWQRQVGPHLIKRSPKIAPGR